MEELERRRFAVGTCLGKGGFGEVYRATMRSAGGLESEVALKVLLEGLDPASQAVQRLRDEGRLLARLDHPTILRVLDLVVLEGRVGLVTDLVEGEDLGECLDEGLPLRALLEVIAEVADALHAAWSSPLPDGSGPMRIVHRDIKPSNIRVSRHGQVVLLDFGIASTDTLRREARTQTNLVVGSPAYLAPERFTSDEAHPGSDVFALGATLYEGVTRSLLYEGVSVLRLSGLALDPEGHAEHVGSRLAALPADTPPDLRAIIAEALVHDPDERPTARELSRLCQALADTLPGDGVTLWARERTWAQPTERDGGPLAGRTLTEGTVARPRPDHTADLAGVSRMSPVAPPPGPGKGRWVALAGGGAAALTIAAVLVVLVGGIGALALRSWLGAEPPEPAEVEAPLEVAELPPPPEDATPDVDSEPELGPVAEEEIEVDPVTPREPAVVPEPAPTGTITTTGKTEIRPHGEVEAGHHTIEARFRGEWVAVDEFEVAEGEVWTVSCSPVLETCESTR